METIPVRVGTAGWSIASALKPEFPDGGSHLERYAQRFAAVEINSSFYRPHKRETYARWAASSPATFRFSVKLPKSITHGARLVDAEPLIERFAGEAEGLGAKFGVALIQLPPSLICDTAAAQIFFATCRHHLGAALAIEPRHPSWFEPGIDEMLTAARVARVAADPATVPAAATPGGWRGLTYMRLHGSPVIYRSSYEDRLPAIAEQLEGSAGERWCIFDNTASMAAIPDALDLLSRLDARLEPCFGQGQNRLRPDTST